MSIDQISLLVGLALGSFTVALLALYGIAWLSARDDKKSAIALAAEDDEIVFLFDDENLVNATSSATALLSSAANVGSDWSKLLSVLIIRFPTLQNEIANLADEGRLNVESRDGSSVLSCRWQNGLARLELVDQESDDAVLRLDRHSILAMEQELDSLRLITEGLPYPVWKETAEGTISWANTAYVSLAEAKDNEQQTRSWPPANIFNSNDLRAAGPGQTIRLQLVSEETDNHWFEATKLKSGIETFYSATPADSAVKAESALREFTQTLTKTFSHLTIGLAVFDRNRELALFNPALTDLTKLSPEFLVSRPALISFLDKLRDGQMMPEPKDYTSWRQEISELETAAEDGSYLEVWSLPDGSTYRVTGRPHPDGAIAFLFEDISAEMSLTRRFRSELETGQAVLDTLDEAVAVFERTGEIVMANSAYTSLWGEGPLDGLFETSVSDATRLWHSKCAPSHIWSDFREFVSGTVNRKEWRGSARLWDGRKLDCRFVPLPSGQTLVGFTPGSASQKGPLIARPHADPSYVNI